MTLLLKQVQRPGALSFTPLSFAIGFLHGLFLGTNYKTSENKNQEESVQFRTLNKCLVGQKKQPNELKTG